MNKVIEKDVIMIDICDNVKVIDIFMMNSAQNNFYMNRLPLPYLTHFLPYPMFSKAHFRPESFWESNASDSEEQSGPPLFHSDKISDTIFCKSAAICD